MEVMHMRIGKGEKTARIIVSTGDAPFLSTNIEYRLEEAAFIRLSIFNILGQHIRLLDNGLRAAGIHRAIWDGRDETGRPVASGVYLYLLRAGLRRKAHKMSMVTTGAFRNFSQ